MLLNDGFTVTLPLVMEIALYLVIPSRGRSQGNRMLVKKADGKPAAEALFNVLNCSTFIASLA